MSPPIITLTTDFGLADGFVGTMKGVIFNLFEEFVCESFGDEVWEEILDSAELKTQEPFVGPGFNDRISSFRVQPNF